MVMKSTEIYRILKKKLSKADIENPSFEAITLMTNFLGIDRVKLALPGFEADPSELMFAVEERVKGRPLQYIIGNTDFYGYTFYVGEGVLIPRFDTELLIDEAKKLSVNKENPKIIDLCSGSGAIAITLEKELKNATVYAMEKSGAALRFLNKNKEALNSRIDVIEADVLVDIPKEISDEVFDIVISNPPYITEQEMKQLPIDVTKEPAMALFGGVDGLDFYRRITELYKSRLNKGGSLIFEIGDTQGASVVEVLERNGFKDIRIVRDLSNKDRAVIGNVS